MKKHPNGISNKELLKDVLKLIKNDRPYAPDLHDKDKLSKELHVVSYLIEILSPDDALYKAKIIEQPKNDPPDCILSNIKGQNFAVEMVELVDNKALEYAVNKKRRYGKKVIFDEKYSPIFDKDTFLEHVKQLINIKDEKCSKNKTQYEFYVLLIYTDEPGINKNVALEYLNNVIFKTKIFARIIMLFSYDPAIQSNTYLNLNIFNPTL